jgi:AcrR family transcriptional regulator
MAKQQRSQITIDKVLEEVAERLFHDDESFLRIPEICEASGVNYGSVYHHFGNRQGLIDAAYVKLYERFIAKDIEQVRALGGHSNTFDEFVIAAHNLVNQVATDPERVLSRDSRLRIVAASRSRPELARRIGELQLEVTNELSNIIQGFKNQGWIRADVEAKEVSVAVQTIVFGRLMDGMSPEAFDDLQWGRMFQSLLFQYIKFPDIA